MAKDRSVQYAVAEKGVGSRSHGKDRVNIMLFVIATYIMLTSILVHWKL
jgi:hypothetical protein